MSLVIILEDLDFVWQERDLTKIAEMWKDGTSIAKISEHFKRDPDEVMLALIHLAKRNRIKKRKGGLFQYLRLKEGENNESSKSFDYSSRG